MAGRQAAIGQGGRQAGMELVSVIKARIRR